MASPTRRSARSRRYRLVSAFTALAVGGGASAAGVKPPPVSGGTAPQRRALTRILLQLHVTGVSATLTQAGPYHGWTLIFDGRSDSETLWKEEVAYGVYRARGYPLTWMRQPGPWGTGRYSLFPIRPRSASFVRSALRHAAAKAHVRLDRVELLHPLAFAPVVTITVPNPSRFAGDGGFPTQALEGYPSAVEGIYVIFRDRHGHVWAQGGHARRIGTGSGVWPGSLHA